MEEGGGRNNRSKSEISPNDDDSRLEIPGDFGEFYRGGRRKNPSPLFFRDLVQTFALS